MSYLYEKGMLFLLGICVQFELPKIKTSFTNKLKCLIYPKKPNLNFSSIFKI